MGPDRGGLLALLLGTRTLLGAPGIATRSKDATRARPDMGDTINGDRGRGRGEKVQSEGYDLVTIDV